MCWGPSVLGRGCLGLLLSGHGPHSRNHLPNKDHPPPGRVHFDLVLGQQPKQNEKLGSRMVVPVLVLPPRVW